LNYDDGGGRFAINANFNSPTEPAEFTLSTIDGVLIFDGVLGPEQIKTIMDKGFKAWRSQDAKAD